jgi:hypothetical protein
VRKQTAWVGFVSEGIPAQNKTVSVGDRADAGVADPGRRLRPAVGPALRSGRATVKNGLNRTDTDHRRGCIPFGAVVQWRLPALVQCIGVCPVLQQLPHGLDRPAIGGPVQEGPTLFWSHGVQAKSVPEGEYRYVVEGLTTPLVGLQCMLQPPMESSDPQPSVGEEMTHHLLIASGRCAENRSPGIGLR